MDLNLILQKLRYKYLGYEIYFNGNLTHTAEALYEKSLKALFSLRRKLNNFQDVSVKVQIKLFDSLIRPILTYGAELWICNDNCKENKLDCLPFVKLHNKFRVQKMASNFACRWDLGRSYIFDYILLQSFKYFDRLIHLPSFRLLYKVITADKELHESRAKSWFTFIEKYASKYNLSLNDFDIKAHQQGIQYQNVNAVLSKLDEYKSSDKNKLYFHSNITENFGLQKYLNLGLPQSKTKYITKLRISSHHLEIERGRYTRPKTLRGNRLCNSCNIVEDEVHFLFFCTKNELARRTLCQI